VSASARLHRTNTARTRHTRGHPSTSRTLGTQRAAPALVVAHGAPPKRLIKKDLAIGAGAVARPHDTITVRYVGALYGSGKIFYSSWQTKRTYSSQLDVTPLIKGWNEGVVGMRVGGRRELIVPPALGYGSRANGSIPGNSTIVFIVDLLKVAHTNGRSTRPRLLP
jgi:peptidylprolyl isomerase